MKKTIFVSMVIIAMALVGLSGAEDFVSGEMKGSDAPQVFKIGGEASDDLFVKTMQPVQLSGTDFEVFEFLGNDWWMDAGVSSYTPSMMAFMKDSIADGMPLVPATKSAAVGLINQQ